MQATSGWACRKRCSASMRGPNLQVHRTWGSSQPSSVFEAAWSKPHSCHARHRDVVDCRHRYGTSFTGSSFCSIMACCSKASLCVRVWVVAVHVSLALAGLLHRTAAHQKPCAAAHGRATDAPGAATGPGESTCNRPAVHSVAMMNYIYVLTTHPLPFPLSPALVSEPAFASI